MKARKFLINYANLTHYKAQKRNSLSGLNFGKFDHSIEFGLKDLDSRFFMANERILNAHRGAGYWLWKPYIILKTMLNFSLEGDYIFYADSGSEWINPVDQLIPILESTQGVMLFNTDPTKDNKEVMQTKRDVFAALGCDTEKHWFTIPRHGGFQFYKNCEFAQRFVMQYLYWCEHNLLITDDPSNLPENSSLIAHRHDQSIMSVLSKKMDIPSFRDPTQFGNQYIKESDGYGQLINHTRLWD
jgi:hypothetical protein